MSKEDIRVEVRPDTKEDETWRSVVEPRLRGLSENVLNICEYGFTEMFNNVIDHSESHFATIVIERTSEQISLKIADFGVGIFRKIRDSLGLPNEHHAFLELQKGRVTTDPRRHTGEGIYFTARMFDLFVILSGTMYVSFKADGNDWAIEEPNSEKQTGTLVIMEIDPKSQRTAKDVFDRFAPLKGDEFAGIKTMQLALRLHQPAGQPLVSRSQAKRLLAHISQFEEAILDFEGVMEIGPAFADEMFRVFSIEHPEIRLIPVNTNESVSRMIVTAKERLRAGPSRPSPSNQ